MAAEKAIDVFLDRTRVRRAESGASGSTAEKTRSDCFVRHRFDIGKTATPVGKLKDLRTPTCLRASIIPFAFGEAEIEKNGSARRGIAGARNVW